MKGGTRGRGEVVFKETNPENLPSRRKLGGGYEREGGWWLLAGRALLAAQRGNEYAGEEGYQKTFSGGKFVSLEKSGFQEMA